MNKNTWIAVAVSVFAVGFYLFGGTIVSMFSVGNPDTQSTQKTMNTNVDNQSGTEGFLVQDEVIGTGDIATPGSTISVHYVGTFENGQKFDSSIDRGEPFEFVLGAGRVIKGWDLGFSGMKVGGKRRLTIPSSLGYGSNQVGPIPPNSTLIFEVELLAVHKAQ